MVYQQATFPKKENYCENTVKNMTTIIISINITYILIVGKATSSEMFTESFSEILNHQDNQWMWFNLVDKKKNLLTSMFSRFPHFLQICLPETSHSFIMWPVLSHLHHLPCHGFLPFVPLSPLPQPSQVWLCVFTNKNHNIFMVIGGLRRPFGPPEQSPIPIESENLCMYAENQMVNHAFHFSWSEWPVPWFTGVWCLPRRRRRWRCHTSYPHPLLLNKQKFLFSRAFCGSWRLQRHSLFGIHFMINWQLSNQGICWPVPHDHIAGSS